MQYDMDTLRAGAQKCHDTVGSAMRWGNDSHPVTGGGCYAGVTSMLMHSEPFWTAFHGDSLPLSFEETVLPQAFNAAKKNCTKDWNKFEGTERSLRWVQFLLSPESPWAALHPFLLEKDPEFINNAGFIWGEPRKIPVKLFYNFMLAERFPWELPQQFNIFLHLVDSGMEPRRALYVSNCFILKPEAKDLSGPWELEYPWSFLEGVSFESTYRFLHSKPKDLKAGAERITAMPNVFPLWSITGEVPVSPFEEMTDEIAGIDALSLDKINETLDWACEKQEAMI